MFLALVLVAFACFPGATVSGTGLQTAQEQASKPASSQPKTPSQPCSATSSSSGAKPDCPPKPKKKHPHVQKNTATSNTVPPKTVVKNGSTTDPIVAISPGLSDQQFSQQMQDTSRLLSSTDAHLKTISGRQLNPVQQDTVKQIRNYVEQAKAAANDGDIQRAYNLAKKADMLSADLAGH